MTYCFNAHCPKPQNPETHRFCQRCGWRLRLGDRYEALHSIGTGQNSRTFLSRDLTTLIKPQCLIKQFNVTGATRLEQVTAAERFRKDMVHWAIASQHPQIPDLLSYFERADQQFVVQQFLIGPDLEQHLQEKRGPFDSAEVLVLLQDVLPILHHLHRHHIIHRDIKPTNFRRVSGQPHWWLVDLGAVKPLTATRIAQPGTVIGSAEYVAPEQLQGAATFASDIYSLGVVCLHLLTGLRPFDLFDTGQGCWHWRSIVPDVQESLATVLDGMVQPRLRDRIPAIDVILETLEIPNSTPAISTPLIQPQETHWRADKEVELGTEILEIASLPQADSLLVLTVSGTVEVRSLQTLDTLQAHLMPSAAVPTTLTPHPHAPTFVLGNQDGSLEVWQLHDNWRRKSLPCLHHSITQLTFTPDGQTLIIADAQGKIHLLDWVTGTVQRTWQEHTSAVTSLAISHSGKILASGDAKGHVTLWHLPTAEPVRTLSRHQGRITALSWLADDRALVTAGWDVTVRWRCPETGGILQSLKAQGFFLPVRSLLAHPTQPYVIAGSQDGQLHCWCLSQANQSTVTGAIATAPQTSAPIMSLCWQSVNPTTAPNLLSVTQSGSLTERSLST